MGSPPMLIDDISILHLGHFSGASCDAAAVAAAAPQCGQWRLPMNIMPKHEAHAIVASFDSQYWQCEESDEIAAPQFGQLRVSACISFAQGTLVQLNILETGVN